MFDWFWEFLYSISKILMKACDWIMQCARSFVGLDAISVYGEETDLMTYLLSSNKVQVAFGASFGAAIVVLGIFTIIAVIRTIAKEQPNTTPGRLVVKAIKNFLMFLLVPVVFFAVNMFVIALVGVLDQATSGGANSIGSYLFVTFAQDAGLSEADAELFLQGTYDYTNLTTVESSINLKDFSFIMSWIVAGGVLYNLATSIVMFVERAITIVLLFIVSPFSISTSVLDDGARYKSWRDQVISKFFTATGVLICINIYALVCGLVVSDEVVFFPVSSTLNNVAKIIILLGGAVAMRKSELVIANLISTAAVADFNDFANAPGRALAGQLARHNPIVWGAKGAGFLASPFTEAVGRKFDDFKRRIGDSMFGGGGGGGASPMGGAVPPGGNAKTVEGATGTENNRNPSYGNNTQGLRNAMTSGNVNGGNNPKSASMPYIGDSKGIMRDNIFSQLHNRNSKGNGGEDNQ